MSMIYTIIHYCIDIQWVDKKGKLLTGNHRFSHEDHGVSFFIFPLNQPSDYSEPTNIWIVKLMLVDDRFIQNLYN